MELDPQQLLKILNKNRDVLILGGFGALMLLIGVREWRRTPPPQVLQEAEWIDEDGDGVVGDVLVDISGAVNRPGVYRFTVGSRTGAAVEAAMGFTQDADGEWIAQKLNLASELVDGSKLYIPFAGEITNNEQGAYLGAQTDSINVNQASLSQLRDLVGVGEARAQNIIDNRPYSSLLELSAKAKIPQSVIDDNSAAISF